MRKYGYDKIAGTIESYGFANGGKTIKGKSLAVIPNEMKKQAQLQYLTQAGKIKFSLSDPNKPYKKIEFRDVDLGDKTYKIKYHSGTYLKGQQPGMRFIGKFDLNLYGEAYGGGISVYYKPKNYIKKKVA